jgi:hypothetical protein
VKQGMYGPHTRKITVVTTIVVVLLGFFLR